MDIKLYYELNPLEKKTFYQFLKSASQEHNQPAALNMWEENWHLKNYTLPYLLEYTDRFKLNGTFVVLFDQHTVVGCSGVYQSNFCDSLCIAGVRTWIAKDYRHYSLNREYLFPFFKKWAIQKNYSAIALTFNDYNKNLIKVFKRKRIGESIERISTREQHHLFYNGLVEIEFPVEIQYTKQWIIYEILNPEFKFNWEKIKWSKK